jgi:hypothetical protein
MMNSRGRIRIKKVDISFVHYYKMFTKRERLKKIEDGINNKEIIHLEPSSFRNHPPLPRNNHKKESFTSPGS